MKSTHFYLTFLIGVALCASAVAAPPNIVWIVVDDMSAHFSCYGETTIKTPHVDRLAREGTRFSRAYVTAPVCSPCRSALITGMYQTTIGAHHHRSGQGTLKIRLPDSVLPVPALFQKAGYFTCIGSGLPDKDLRMIPYKEKPAGNNPPAPGGKIPARLGKTDYNFTWDAAIYDSHDWAGRAPAQPFFMQVQLPGGKLRGESPAQQAALRSRVTKELGSATDASLVKLPPYYPRDPVLLDDWAAYLDAVRITDAHVGAVLTRLEAEGLLENTLVIFITDHGISHARGKQFLYDEGTHIPFIVRGPGIPKGAVRDDLIEHIDMAALSLAAAGIPLPAKIQGRDIFGKNYQPRTEVYAARDRCDETVERLRSVRSDHFLYIRNFHPARPHLQPNAYKDGKTIIKALRAAHAAHRLPALTEALLFSPTRPREELYEYRDDRWQITNLAEKPDYQQPLERHRALLDDWMRHTGDPGPEAAAMFDSDMLEYTKKPNPAIDANINLMKQWAAEGK